MAAQRIIIDTDPGIDDAMAIHLAFADERLDLLGLTTIFGNVSQEQALRNALFLTEQAGMQIPVARGADNPLVQPANTPSYHVHGDEGFGTLPAPAPVHIADSRDAMAFISETCRAHSGEVILCPVGPLTNIAQLLVFDPEIVRHVKKLVIMGGAVWCPGNVSPFAEANIWNDPHAADAVFAADWEIDLIGLDVTQSIVCTHGDFERLKKHAPEIGGFISTITDFYIQFYHSVLGQHVCVMHDPSAVIAITDRALFTFRQTALEVQCKGERIGQTVPAPESGRRPVNVAISADADKIKNVFLEICAKADMIKTARKPV